MEVYEAKYDYCDECGDSLLSFKKGDKFIVTYKDEGGWWAAQNLSNNEIGYIPSSFVEVKNICLCFLSVSVHLLEIFGGFVVKILYYLIFKLAISLRMLWSACVAQIIINYSCRFPAPGEMYCMYRCGIVVLF